MFRKHVHTLRWSTLALTAASTLAATAIAGVARADAYDVLRQSPALDRWNYPFNPTPGTRITASTFGNEAGSPLFDNRDGQFVLGFNLAPEVPSGLGASSYTVTTCTVTITYANDFVVEYDPTVDPYTVFLPAGDPEATDDEDPGQPIELYGTGFRNGFSLNNWLETSPFTLASLNSLNPSVRNAFALGQNAQGAWVDVSNSVRERWTPTPFAVGVIDGMKAGSLIPEGSVMRFELDVARADVQEFLRNAVDAGRLRLTITSLTKVVQQGGSFPQFYCRENPLVAATGIGDATLELSVTTNSCSAADLDCNGEVGAPDLSLLLANWGNSGTGDIDADGDVGAADLSLLLAQWGS
jgi:hypothetical protein